MDAVIRVYDEAGNVSDTHEQSPGASIFELASVLNEARARKARDLPSSRRKGIVRVAKG